jgi:hypothetical protein
MLSLFSRIVLSLKSSTFLDGLGFLTHLISIAIFLTIRLLLLSAAVILIPVIALLPFFPATTSDTIKPHLFCDPLIKRVSLYLELLIVAAEEELRAMVWVFIWEWLDIY